LLSPYLLRFSQLLFWNGICLCKVSSRRFSFSATKD